MRRILSVLTIAAALLLSVFTSVASATPGTLYAYSDIEATFTVSSCVTATTQLILETENSGVLVTDTFNMTGYDHCAQQEVFQIWGGSGNVSGVSFDTYGMTMNSTFRGTDVDSTDSYDLWFNLRLKCVDTIARFHPGVACDGDVSGTLAFSKYRLSTPPDAGGYLTWRMLRPLASV